MLTQTASLVSLDGYIIFIDFMNNMGHCNFEMVPKKLFSIFPPLKCIRYHSLHHIKFGTNYSLFMPIYDCMYGTMGESTDALHETSLKRQEDAPDVVHLTHLTTPDSIYHLRLGVCIRCIHAPRGEMVPRVNVACDLVFHDHDLHL